MKLKKIVEKVIDNRGKTPPLVDNGYELLEVNAVNESSRTPDYQKVRKFVSKDTYENWFRTGNITYNDILIPTVGTIGGCCISKQERGSIAQNLIALRINKQIADPDYIFYYFRTSFFKKELLNLDIGGVQPSIKVPHLLNLEISLPPLSEQKRISSILSSFDNKIEQLKKENNILEDIAQNIFKEWFVKYNFPNKDGKPYKDNNGKMINSELGLIPEGWRVVSLTDIADFVNGLPMQKYRPKEGQAFLPVIKIKELNSGYSKETEKARTDLDEKYIVNPGDLVFSWSGSIGMDLWKYSKGALNQHLFKVTSTKYPKWFYYYWIKHYLPEFKQIAEGKATTMGHIQRGHLANSLLPAPKDFKNYELFEAILQKEINNNKNINNLNEQKLSNLKYLIN